MEPRRPGLPRAVGGPFRRDRRLRCVVRIPAIRTRFHRRRPTIWLRLPRSQQRPCTTAASVRYPDFIATRPIRAKEKLVTVGRQLRVIVVRTGGLDAAERSRRACGEIQAPDVGIEGTPLVHHSGTAAVLWMRGRRIAHIVAEASERRRPLATGNRHAPETLFRDRRTGNEQQIGVGQPRRTERHPLVERELSRRSSCGVVVVQRQDKDLARASEKSCKCQSGPVTGKFGIDVGPRLLETR